MSDEFSTELGFEPEAFDPRKHRLVRSEERAQRVVDENRIEWRPQSHLPDPDKEDGYVFRWVRRGMNGIADTKNVSQKFAEGWEPVSAASQQRLAALLGKHGVNTEGNIEIGGLILCKMPKEIAEARNRYYGNMADAQQRAVDNQYLRDNNRKMPKLAPERLTSVSNRAT